MQKSTQTHLPLARIRQVRLVATLKVDWSEWEFHEFPPIKCALKTGTNIIEFVSHNPAIKLQNDDRLLAVAVKNLAVATTDR